MVKVLTMLLMVMFLFGCVSGDATQGATLSFEDLVKFTTEELDKVGTAVASVSGDVIKVNASLEQAKADTAKLEEIIGPIDTDNDGIISAKEASDAYARTAASVDPKAAGYLTNSAIWTQLSSLAAAGFVAKKLERKVPVLGALIKMLTQPVGAATPPVKESEKA